MRRRAPGARLVAGLALPEVLLALVGFVVPVALLVAYSFGRADPVSFDVTVTGTLAAYRTLFSELYRPVLYRSFAMAGLTVAMCVLVGTPAALALSRLSTRWQRRAVLLIVFPSFISFTVRVYSWSTILGKGGPIDRLTGETLLYRPAGVLLGILGVYIPLFVLPAYIALQRVPSSLLEAAADLGARPWRQTRSVLLPLALPGLVTGAVVVGVLAVGEVVIPDVLGGGKVLLLGNVLQQRGTGRDQPLGGAICAVLLVAFALLALLVTALRRRDAIGA